RDPRIKETQAKERNVNRLVPHLREVHEVEALRPYECYFLLQNNFLDLSLGLGGGAWGYCDWVLEQDLTATYDYYRTQLQILAWKWPGCRLVLKCPYHTLALPQLLRLFPDAFFLNTHREPPTVIASYCSLLARAHSLFTSRINARKIGETTLRS